MKQQLKLVVGQRYNNNNPETSLKLYSQSKTQNQRKISYTGVQIEASDLV